MAVLLIPNTTKDLGLTVTRRIAALLQQWNIMALLPDTYPDAEIPGVKILPEEDAYRAADQVLTIGGDGTLLRCGHCAREHQEIFPDIRTDSSKVLQLSLGAGQIPLKFAGLGGYLDICPACPDIAR